MGFPMEMYQFPSYDIWVVSHKPIAVAAGLGHMGIHCNVIHPEFGNFVLLGTVLVDAEATAGTVAICVGIEFGAISSVTYRIRRRGQ